MATEVYSCDLPGRSDYCLTYAAVGRSVFFFNDTATTEIYTLSLHDALPIFLPFICAMLVMPELFHVSCVMPRSEEHTSELQSHSFISYAGFCLKKRRGRSPSKFECLLLISSIGFALTTAA